MAKLSIADARGTLAGLAKTSSLADVEARLGPAARRIEVHGNIPAHVFVVADGEVRVGSYDGIKLRYIRLFERPAGLPAGAGLDDEAKHYVLLEGRTRTTYSLEGAALRRVTLRGPEERTVEVAGAGGQLVRSIEPLCGAIQRKRKGEVKKLLTTESPIGTYQSGRTALHHLAECLPDAELAKLMIAAGVEVDARDDANETPLYVAIEHRPARSALVEALLAAGADINALCGKYAQDTVLHLAVHSKSGVLKPAEEELAIWLIEQGANPELADSNGATPREVAIDKGRSKILAAMDRASKPKPTTKPKPPATKTKPAPKPKSKAKR